MNKKFAILKERRQRRMARLVMSNNDRVIEILEKVVGMSDEQREAMINDFVKGHGLKETYNLIQKTIKNITQKNTKAQLYEGFKNKKEPSGFEKYRESLGDFGVLLTLLLLLGTGGAVEMGEAGDVIKSALLTAGSAFLTWVVKKLPRFGR